MLLSLKAVLWSFLRRLPRVHHVAVTGTAVSKMRTPATFKRILISPGIALQSEIIFAFFVVLDKILLSFDLNGCLGLLA